MNLKNIHPVIKNLLARRNRKPPFLDKRKIAVVLFGGCMAGIRGAGAMIAIEELGLGEAFDEIYTVSSGFCTGSYFLANQHRFGTSIYYDDLSGRKFINFLKPWRLADIEYMIRVMSTNKALDVKTILSGKTKLYARLRNMATRKIEYLEVHKFPEKDYMKIMEAATAMPLLYPKSVLIEGIYYKDPGAYALNTIEHIQKVLDSNATDIVIIFNTMNQYNTAKNHFGSFSNRVFVLHPEKSWSTNRLETSEAKLREYAERMGLKMKQAFGERNGIVL